MGCIPPSQYIQHFNFRFIIRLYFLLRFSTHYHALQPDSRHLKELFGVLFVKVINYHVQSVGYRRAICRIYA